MESVEVEMSSETVQRLDGMARRECVPREELAVDLLDEWLDSQVWGE